MASGTAPEANGAPLVTAPLTMAVPVDLDVAIARLTALGRRFGPLVRSITDGRAPTRGLDWTLAETAVHVMRTFGYYESSGRGETEVETEPIDNIPAYVARRNREEIDYEPERDPSKIADAIEAGVSSFAAWAKQTGPDAIASFSPRYSMDVTTTVCTLIGELVVHGYDIARSIGAPWKIDPATAVLAVYSTSAALPLAFDARAAAGVSIEAQFRMRHAVPFSVHIEDGRVWSESSGTGTPDVRLSADPMAYLLVGFGRSSLWPAIARGQIFAWGRKPWLMARLPKYFMKP